MSSFGQIQFKLVKKMLRKCALGHEIKQGQHLQSIYYNGLTAQLPKGPHGKSRNFSIEIGHIKQMVHQFQIEDCARQHLPQLGKIKARATT